MRLRRAWVTAALAILALAAPARADLEDDAARIARIFAQRGAEVARLEPMFLERGRARTLDVDRAPLAGGTRRAPAGDAQAGCITVVVLSVRTGDFLVGTEDPPRAPGLLRATPDPGALAPEAPPDDHRTRAAAGAATLVRCGADRSALGRVTIEVTSARAAVEVLVARSAAPLGEIRDVLPERAVGPIAPRGDPGGPIEPGPLLDRLARAERRARVEGAAEVSRVTRRASSSGAGRFELPLVEGCHRLDLMAEIPGAVPRRATDLDAEAHAHPGGKLLARDRADVPDARLDFCLGEPTLVEAAFAGASGAVTVAVSDAVWLIPRGVPARWGARGRAGFAAALHKRHAPAPPEAAIAESLGIQGATRVPIAVEPGRCYLAAVALIRGEARALRLSAKVGARVPHDDVVDRPEGAALAFCAEMEDSVVLDVDARGNAPWWALEVWPMGGVTP